MTTQTQLLQLAQNHVDNTAVRLLLLSLAEAKGQANQKLAGVLAAATTYGLGVQGEPGYSVGRDQSDFVAMAASAQAAMSRMAADYCTLACLLVELGEDISY